MMENRLTAAQADTISGPHGLPRLPSGRRVYAVGDVHGHLDKLQAIHARVAEDLRARPVARPLLLHLGDLVDRGPDSAGCIALLAAGPPLRGVPTVSLMGNHERMMLDALAGRAVSADTDTWMDNGGDRTLSSFGLRSTAGPVAWLDGIPARSLVFLKGLALMHAAGRYVFVHAGVRPGVALARQRPTDLLWIRESFLNHQGPALPGPEADRVVVHGHTPAPEAELLPWRLGLDTGAGKGGPLTCAVLEADEVRLLQA